MKKSTQEKLKADEAMPRQDGLRIPEGWSLETLELWSRTTSRCPREVPTDERH